MYRILMLTGVIKSSDLTQEKRELREVKQTALCFFSTLQSSPSIQVSCFLVRWSLQGTKLVFQNSISQSVFITNAVY